MNNQYKLSITFLVFGKNNDQLFLSTLQEISDACTEIKNIQYEIILVDDGSRNKGYQRTIQSFERVKVLNIGKSLGIAGAVLGGTRLANYDYVLPIPGHDMFSATAIKNVIDLTGKGRLIIGCRDNLSDERPFLKKLASRVLLMLYRAKFVHYIGDVHGLILFEKNDILKYLNPKDGHGHAIKIISNVVKENGLIIQTIAPIKKGHRILRSKNFLNNIPSPKNTLAVIRALLKIKKVRST